MVYKIKFFAAMVLVVCFSFNASAAVVSEYALNSYNDHVLSRSEKKCMDEGYQITYASCANQTAPADRCPHHDAYYRSCSQEQWCRNNNYVFLEKDCVLPSYPVKKCDNEFPIYRACQKNPVKACKDKGYFSAAECILSDERCEFDSDYGKCCTECPDFPYTLKNIPEGYVASGETCKTCEGIIKTKVKEAPCEDYVDCEYGPMSQQTPFCMQGKKILYSACKTSETLCREKGYLNQSCSDSEDAEPCPEFEDLKKCKINCYKYAKNTFADSDIIDKDETNPDFDSEKTGLRSLYGNITTGCVNTFVPTITIDINQHSQPIYRELFNRNISNINFVLNFEEPLTLDANGTLENVRIKVEGTPAACALSGKKMKIIGKVMLSGEGDVCTDLELNEMSKFTTAQSVKGNVVMGSNSQLGIKGNLIGSLITKPYCEVFIKGKLHYKNTKVNTEESEGIVFGCNTHAKIINGITAETANVIAKQYALIDTPSINIISTGSSDSNAASLHLYKYTKITSILGDSEYMLTDNSSTDATCDDKYIIHKASALDENSKTMSLNTADSLDGKWTCRSLNKLQMRCN